MVTGKLPEAALSLDAGAKNLDGLPHFCFDLLTIFVKEL